MIRLLDLNLLIALSWPSHVHHPQAHAWFADRAPSGWATCPFTQCGFVRLSSNPRIIPEAVPPQQALALLEEIVAHPHHIFWPDAVPLVGTELMSTQLLVGHRQVTDAYLLGLAIHHGGKLATLDQGIAHLLPSNSPHKAALEIVPVA